MVGVDQNRQGARARDAPRLLGKLGQREQDQIGRTEHGQRGHRAGENAKLKLEMLGNAGRDRVVYRGRRHAGIGGEQRTHPLTRRD